MSAPRSYPPFDESLLRDYEDGDGSLDPFAWCEHALDALRAGDPETALATLAQRDHDDDPDSLLASRMGGEAENLIRAGLLAEAELRLERAVCPKFATLADAAAAYRKARVDERSAEQLSLFMEHAA